jgi:hypothetical protein
MEEGKTLITVSGTWISCNQFRDEQGNVFKVTPYLNLLTRYRDQFPINCYLLLYGHTVKDIVVKE